MSKELFNLPMGPEASFSGSIGDDGKAHLVAQYKGQDDVSVSLEVIGGPKAALDHVKTLIPGTLDDMIIDGAEAALGLK